MKKRRKKKNWKSVTEERDEMRMGEEIRGRRSVRERIVGAEMKERWAHTTV